jgi:hypothetical protein
MSGLVGGLMVTDATKNNIVVWKESTIIWASLLVIAALLGFIFWDGLEKLAIVWGEKEEYSYGYMIPFITLFLLWQKKEILERIPFSGSWAGVMLMLVGLILYVLGNLSTLFLIVQYFVIHRVAWFQGNLCSLDIPGVYDSATAIFSSRNLATITISFVSDRGLGNPVVRY